MHELSIASQIWASVTKAAAEHKASRVAAVKLEIGALTLIEEEQVSFWIETLAERDGSAGVKVSITRLPGRIRCLDCGREGETEAPEGQVDHFLPLALRCAHCGSRNIAVTGGQEIRVASAEIEQEGKDGTG